MASSSKQIRSEIENSQKRLADTVEAIGYKADIGQRTREAVQEKKQRALQPLKRTRDKIATPLRKTKDRGGSAAGKVRSTIPDAGQVRKTSSRAGQTIKEEPSMLAAASLGAGFVLGLLFKLRQKEMEVLAPAAQVVRRGARQASEKALDRGKRLADEIPPKASAAAAQVTQQAATQAVEKAKRTGTRSASKGKQAARKAADTTTPKTRSRTSGTSMVARRATATAAGAGAASGSPTGRARTSGRPSRARTSG